MQSSSKSPTFFDVRCRYPTSFTGILRLLLNPTSRTLIGSFARILQRHSYNRAIIQSSPLAVPAFHMQLNKGPTCITQRVERVVTSPSIVSNARRESYFPKCHSYAIQLYRCYKWTLKSAFQTCSKASTGRQLDFLLRTNTNQCLLQPHSSTLLPLWVTRRTSGME